MTGSRREPSLPSGTSRTAATAGAVAVLAVVGCAPGHQPSGDARFVTSAACASCHPAQFAAWKGSHHDRAMQVAADSTVLGDFGDATFTHLGVTSRFFRRAGAFVVNTEGPDGRGADFEVRYTFGVEPLQQYLVALPRGRLQALPVAWDTRRGRWFHLYPDERIQPGDPLHWTGPYLNWNAQCAACHSTRVRKNYVAEADSYATTWSDPSVGCEACHGVGAEHVAWAERAGGKAGREQDRGLSVAFSDGRREVEVCAPCHSRRSQITDAAEPGEPLLDHFVPVRLQDGLYFPDGQMLDEVYVYGSFLQSRMYAAGVRCSDCHEPHSLELRAEGNALCTRCHGEAPDRRFPMLKAGRYDSPEHHFHRSGTAGTQCVACHMPTRTYMVVDPRHDHGFKVPRPDLSAALGVPHACGSCHKGSAEWAANEIRKRRGGPPAGPSAASFGATLVAGRAGSPAAMAELARLAADTTQPAIVRATALDLLGTQGPGAERVLDAALRDHEPLVRLTAARGMEPFEARHKVEALAPLLHDPRRAVRIEAARVLAVVPRDRFDEKWVGAFDRALEEYLGSLRVMTDLPSGHMGFALIHEAQGRDDLAEASYRAALEKDAAFLPARFNLAHLCNRAGRNADAERVLRAGLAWAPDDGELHYSLGLLLAEENRHEESERELGRAAALLPDRARVALNHGLVLQRLGRLREAERALQRAYALDRTDPDVLAALGALRSLRRR